MTVTLTEKVIGANRSLTLLHERVNRWKGQKELLDRQWEMSVEKEYTEHTLMDTDNQALIILHELEETWRGKFESALAGVGGQGLSAVFGEDIQVVIDSVIKRGVANLDMHLVTEGLETDIMGSKGGSVVNVFSTLLRFLFTLSNTPELRRILVLDEPFTHVSAEYRPALCDMLREMANRLGFQLLFSSHEEELVESADTAYVIVKDGKGTLERLKSPEEASVL